MQNFNDVKDTMVDLCVAPFTSPPEQTTLALAGGKGMNLAALSRLGFAVPQGFILTTAAYVRHTRDTGLDTFIADKVAAVDPSARAPYTPASTAIRAQFRSSRLADDLAAAVTDAYRTLMGGGAVAVRSSATAEDLPEMSFAGQQDTILNVVGDAAVLTAVLECWSSLYTERAMAYRAQNKVPCENLALAVVVQAMVPSEASGVMFTANPLTGLRSETIIDATLGLGEALVSGQVIPDHYVVDMRTDPPTIAEKTLGEKALVMRCAAGGGVEDEGGDDARAGVQALSDKHIIELARIGARISAELGGGDPQDIEWATSGGELHILQSRAITSLFPLPPPPTRQDLATLYFSFGSFQGMLDPVTPVGADALMNIFGGGSSHYFPRTHTPEVEDPSLDKERRAVRALSANIRNQRLMRMAASRIWIDASKVIRHIDGRRIFHLVMYESIAPSVGVAVKKLWDDVSVMPPPRGCRDAPPCRRCRLICGIAPLLRPCVTTAFRAAAQPEARLEWFLRRTDAMLVDFRTRASRCEAVAAGADSAAREYAEGEMKRVGDPDAAPSPIDRIPSFIREGCECCCCWCCGSTGRPDRDRLLKDETVSLAAERRLPIRDRIALPGGGTLLAAAAEYAAASDALGQAESGSTAWPRAMDPPHDVGWRVALRDRVRLFIASKDTLPAMFAQAVGTCFPPGQAGLQILGRATVAVPGLLERYHEGAGAAPGQDSKPPSMGELGAMYSAGQPHNVTTEMDLELWELSRIIKEDADSCAVFEKVSHQEIGPLWRGRELPPGSFSEFIDLYGVRGLAEIDLGRPRWAEEPERLASAIQAYLRIDSDDERRAPDKVFARSAARVDEIFDAVLAASPFYVRPRLRRAYRVARTLAGMREFLKFLAIQVMAATRAMLLRSGADLVRFGVLRSSAHIFMLRVADLGEVARQAMEGGPTEDEAQHWRDVIEERLADREREMRRRQIPCVLLSDGRTFFEGIGDDGGGDDDDDDGVIKGAGVSPGMTVARARVVLDPGGPDGRALQTGEIMVCPGTDPSWTPLFLVAGGLVCEVGGMVTHGSVVAREYGIPAVVGVGDATRVIKTGQRLRLNGSTGRITVLDDDDDEEEEAGAAL